MSAQDWYARRLGQGQQQQAYRPPPQPEMGTWRQPQHQQQPQVYGHEQQQQAPEPQLDLHNFVAAMGAWRGGQALKTDNYSCPECGSHLFFTRSNAKSRSGGQPAPHCFSCGYSGGLFTQGEASTWQAAG